MVTFTAAVAVIVNMSDCNHSWAYLHLFTSWIVIILYTELLVKMSFSRKNIGTVCESHENCLAFLEESRLKTDRQTSNMQLQLFSCS